MKCEDDRNQRIREAAQNQIAKLESQIETIRARIEKERGILTKHEITLNRKVGKGTDVGVTQERVDNKRELVSALESRLTELEVSAMRVRDIIRRLLTFDPVMATLDQLPPRFRLAGKGERRKVNSRFKTFQDIFTPPEARILPNTRYPLTRKRYDKLPLDACPVDPERIPDWFFEEFDLGSLEGLSDFEKLERKVEVTPQIREIFTHLKPMEAHGRQTHRAMVLDGYDEAHDGKILVTSYSGRDKDGEDRKIMQVYGSVYEAHRRTAYTNEGYDREQEKLHGIKARIRGIQRELVGMRKDDPKKDELVKRIASELEMIGIVANCHKVEAADILAAVMNLSDGSGRHNPGATCARMVRAVGLLEKRLPQIFEKSRWVSDDKKILNSTINKGKGVMEQARVASLGLCEGLQEGMDGENIRRTVDSMSDLQEMTVRPFNIYGAKLQEKMDDIKACLKRGDSGVVRDEAINAYVACKVFEVQHERERILRDIAGSPMETTIENLLDRASKLQELVNSKETFPDVRTGINEPYNEMRLSIQTLVRGLQIYSKRNLSESERLAMYERLKKYLEDIDFTEVLEKL